MELVAEKYQIIALTPNGDELTGSNGIIASQRVSYLSGTSLKFAAILVLGGDPKSISHNRAIDDLLRKAHENFSVLVEITEAGSV